MKLLMVTNKVRTYALGFQNSINPLLSLGHEIVWAADFSQYTGDMSEIPCRTEQISIYSWPLRKCNVDAFRKLLRIIEKENIEAVICSTPIGGFLARIAARIKKVRPVIYAAHGFCFFKGAPLIYNTVYKWEEILLAHWTDALITINDEDYRAAQKLIIRGDRKPYRIHGAGVKTGVTTNISREEKRMELGIPLDAFLVVSAGELSKGKGNDIIIEAIAKMKDLKVHYVLCGIGNCAQKWHNRAEKIGLSEQIHFLGYRNDVAEIMSCADAFAIPSIVEGVPRALLEAMDLGLPCVGSRTRGIQDLLGENEGGFLCHWRDAEGFASALTELKANASLRESMGNRNRGSVQEYSCEQVSSELYQIYTEVLGEHRE